MNGGMSKALVHSKKIENMIKSTSPLRWGICLKIYLEEFKMDLNKIEEHIRGILIALGEDPDREGLKETPKRVANMFAEVFKGIKYSNKEIAKMFDKTFEDGLTIETESKDMVIVKDIDIISHCEHHLALMYNMKVAVAYIPNGKIIGLSKIARIADMVGRRLQLQERIGSDIAEIMQIITES